VLSICALGLAAAALAVVSAQDDVTERLVFVHNQSDNDTVDDKATRATCPGDSVLIGGGAAIQHGQQYAPTGAFYQGLPIEGGWEAQAHETDPAAAPHQPWTLESIAVCIRR
jgi:hypothetical protein